MKGKICISGSQLCCALEQVWELGPHHRDPGSVGLSGTQAQDCHMQPRQRTTGLVEIPFMLTKQQIRGLNPRP